MMSQIACLAPSFCVRNAFKIRRTESSDLLEAARGAISRAVSLCLKPPGSQEISVGDFFDEELATWAKKGPSYEGLPNAPNFLECFYKSLSVWERAVLLIVACEAGLVHRYKRNRAEELRIHDIIIAGGPEVRRSPTGIPVEADQILTWAVGRWKEVYAASAAYAGHPEGINLALGRSDWDDDLKSTMKLLDEWDILSEARGNWEIRWNQLVGVVRASEGRDFWNDAREHLDKAIELARNISGRQLVHSLIFRLWVATDPEERRTLQTEIDSLSNDPKRSPDSFRRVLYKEHRDSLWEDVFPPVPKISV
ncbi:MAG: hypothetical protein WBD99_14290 [Thermodesulfobacteriota bacterium]